MTTGEPHESLRTTCTTGDGPRDALVVAVLDIDEVVELVMVASAKSIATIGYAPDAMAMT